MSSPDPADSDGIVATYFFVVADQDRARDWYREVFGARPINERDPLILDLYGSTLILNEGGGPTADKPGVVLQTPDPDRTSAFLNIRVPDIERFHAETSARGAQWLTPPIDRGPEIRGYIRDPDGHNIEIGQSST